MAKIYTIRVEGEATEPEDAEVAGVYLVEVRDEAPEGFEVTAALDCLHANIAIAGLDDFAIAVFDEAGNLVFEREDADGHALAMEKFADFLGDAPANSPSR